jgi:hypothetical protein
MVIVPPYCGVPRLSHQVPVATVVVVDAVVVGTVVVTLVVGFVVWVGVVVVVDVEIDVVPEQDTKTSDVIMRNVSTIQIAPLFIHTSFLNRQQTYS